MTPTEVTNAINAANTGGGSIFSSSTEKTLSATTTAADIVAANPDRQDFYFQNTSKTVYVWANEFGTAVTGSAGQIVPPGGTFVATSPNAVSVVAESGTVYCAGAES